jgi:fluoride exporter
MEESLAALLWIALGGAIGGPARFFVSGLIGRRFGETFPWGTMAVNVAGSFTIGMAAALANRLGTGPWLFGVGGVLGSFTTVSSFSLQTLALARAGEPARAAANIALSVGLCLAAAALGYALAAGTA